MFSSKEEFISVDPGTERTGIAVWRNGMLLEVDTLLGGDGDWFDRTKALAGLMEKYLFTISPAHMFVEYPKIFNNPSGLKIGLDGSIEKLATVVGVYCGVALMRGIVPVLVPVNTWKGQLPKDVVIKRIKRILGVHVCKELGIILDEWDAVGIGLHILGRF